jgi:molybdenum cofactor cytidylyltransferase
MSVVGTGTVSAILLAAGESRRMGAANKLLLEVDGEAMVRRVARALIDSRADEVVVVLGHQANAVGQALDGLEARAVVNADYRDGQMSSMRAGVAALNGEARAIMICLADQPWLEASDVNFLIDAFDARARGSITVPMVGGRRGNPIVLAGAHRQDILDGGANYGCRRLIERHPEKVCTVQAPNDHFLRDIDTPESYAALSGQA